MEIVYVHKDLQVKPVSIILVQKIAMEMGFVKIMESVVVMKVLVMTIVLKEYVL
jgi:hypothetical protein